MAASKSGRKKVSYKDAGVDIDEADRAVALIRQHARQTFTQGVLTDIGSFGAAFQLGGYKQPVLISSADGVGTKLKVAFMVRRHDTIGEDLVNHCVNDIAVQGAVPLFFLDYFAIGRLNADVAGEVIGGVARGCQRNGLALIGGETAEMPGLYAAGEYDLAGFIVGAVERRNVITGSGITAGDILLGLPSSGLHTNGYSLARRLLFEVAGYKPTQKLTYDRKLTVGDELLKVHRSYLRPIRMLIDNRILKGAAHITGGGITDNLPRILPQGLAARIDTKSWRIPAIFELLRELGNLSDADFRRTFNLGIGMVLVVSRRNLAAAADILDRLDEKYYQIGQVVESSRARVIYR